jgi:hypothetical protein
VTDPPPPANRRSCPPARAGRLRKGKNDGTDQSVGPGEGAWRLVHARPVPTIPPDLTRPGLGRFRRRAAQRHPCCSTSPRRATDARTPTGRPAMRKRYLTAVLCLAFASGCCALCRDRASTYYPPVYVVPPEPMPPR